MIPVRALRTLVSRLFYNTSNPEVLKQSVLTQGSLNPTPNLPDQHFQGWGSGRLYFKEDPGYTGKSGKPEIPLITEHEVAVQSHIASGWRSQDWKQVSAQSLGMPTNCSGPFRRWRMRDRIKPWFFPKKSPNSLLAGVSVSPGILAKPHLVNLNSLFMNMRKHSFLSSPSSPCEVGAHL